MTVTYIMGESTLIADAMARRKERPRFKHAILVAPEKRQTKTADRHAAAQRDDRSSQCPVP